MQSSPALASKGRLVQYLALLMALHPREVVRAPSAWGRGPSEFRTPREHPAEREISDHFIAEKGRKAHLEDVKVNVDEKELFLVTLLLGVRSRANQQRL